MKALSTIRIIACAATVAGCVTEGTYLSTQSELDKARKSLAQQTASLDNLKNEIGKEQHELVAEKKRTEALLAEAQASLTKTQHQLDSAKTGYQQEREKREALDGELSKLQNARDLHNENLKLKRDLESARGNVEHLQQLLQSSQQVVATGNQALDDANRRWAAGVKEKERLAAAVAESQNRGRDLESKLVAEQAAANEARQGVDDQVNKMRAEQEQWQQRAGQLKQDRDRLLAKTDGLQRQMQAMQQEAVSNQNALEEANARLAEFTKEREQMVADLAKAQQQVKDIEAKLTAGQAQEAKTRQALEERIGALQTEQEQLRRRSAALREERDQLSAKADELNRLRQAAQQDLSTSKKSLVDSTARLAAVTTEKDRVAAALAEAREKGRKQESRLTAEQAKTTTLNEQTQVLLAGAMKAQDQIARLEKQIGQLESERARGEELAMRLSERDQQIGSLRQAVSDRESVAGRLSALTDKLDTTNKQIVDLNGELSSAAERAILAEEERDRLASHVTQQQTVIAQAEEERDRLRQEHGALQTALRKYEEDYAKYEETEKARLDSERAAKEAEAKWLSKAQEELTQTLQPEVAKGDARIQQADDRLVITLADRVLFDPGWIKIKPDGAKILKRVTDILKTLSDKHIRVESHTDDVPIAPKFRGRFPTNWELSAARATSVVRHFVEQDGMNRDTFSAAGYADTKPVASNDSEGGRATNRRIEIVVSTKDLTVVATDAKP